MRVVAITRAVPSTFARALCAVAPTESIDVDRARVEHRAYCDALRAAGAGDVVTLAAADACPDCVFVEDTAVVAGGTALVTVPGAPSRRAETDPVARELAKYVDVVRMELAATLDGGDCMRVGRTIFVGRSARTNADGIAFLVRTFTPLGFRVVALDLPADVLHLKCVCSPLGDDRILLADGTIPRDAFTAAAGLHVVAIPHEELYAANAVAFPADTAVSSAAAAVLVADGYPRTRELLERAGFRVLAVPATQVSKADGSLTCQSILVEVP